MDVSSPVESVNNSLSTAATRAECDVIKIGIGSQIKMMVTGPLLTNNVIWLNQSINISGNTTVVTTSFFPREKTISNDMGRNAVSRRRRQVFEIIGKVIRGERGEGRLRSSPATKRLLHS